MDKGNIDDLAQDVLESLLEGCQVIGFDWTYLYVNATVVAHGQRSLEDLLGQTMMACYPGIEHTAMFGVLRRCMAERTHQRMENEFTFPDGSTGWFELRFVPVAQGTCILSMDITERKRAEAALARSEEQLRHAQKMEAVGRLAGGIAHDFNNLLSAILGFTKLALKRIDVEEPAHAYLEDVFDAGQRAAELTKQLLAFSRRQVLEPRTVDLNDVLARLRTILLRVVGEDVAVAILPAPELDPCVVDPGQFEQVVVNLVVNARDAMPQGGHITIETSNVVLDEGYVAQHLEAKPGPHVLLAVSDTGHGMDKATQARIFEPFFTTKEVGRGTGLGLSTVFGIVKQSGGHIWVYSEPGHGTTFKIYFPRGTHAAPADRIARPAEPAVQGGTETILLVDDDERVRALCRTVLTLHGYQVLDAPNAGEALLVAESQGAAIQLLLTDVVLPRMSGRALAERFQGQRPTMRVLYMSGYTEDAIVHHGVLDAGINYIAKPILPDALLRKVRQVLDGAASGASSGAGRRDTP